ncbi:MAG: hypothetical protein J2P21_17185 [Chloracidobacterium sp.]|nr:hypothetical protein [Chloracidobacterium sp.]
MIGSAELVAADPPMGYASGPFSPNENYKLVQPVIRERHMYDGTLGKVSEQKLRETGDRIDALRLSVVTEDGEALDPSNGFDIADFSSELDEDPYELEILGLPFEIYDRLFPLAWQEYGDSFKGIEQGR